jgi:hypothetical protein
MIRFKVIPAIASAVMLAATLASSTAASASSVTSVPKVTRSQAVFRPTAAEKAHLEKVVSTAAGRQKLLGAFEQSYGRFARVGLGVGKNTHGRVTPDLTDGVAWDHIWMIASFTDVYRGLVAGAEGVCLARSPVKWICVAAGGFLINMTNGHAWTDSHGVWVAYYWWPYLHETGGFW